MKEKILKKANIEGCSCSDTKNIPYEYRWDNISNWIPEDPENVCFFIDLYLGTDDGQGDYCWWVVTKKGFKENTWNKSVLTGPKIFLDYYTFDNLMKKIDEVLEKCKGSNWKKISKKLKKHTLKRESSL